MKKLLLTLLLITGCTSSHTTYSPPEEPEQEVIIDEPISIIDEETDLEQINCLVMVLIKNKKEIEIRGKKKQTSTILHLPLYIPCYKLAQDDDEYVLTCAEVFELLGIDKSINNTYKAHVPKSSCQISYGKSLNPDVVNRKIFKKVLDK